MILYQQLDTLILYTVDKLYGIIVYVHVYDVLFWKSPMSCYYKTEVANAGAWLSILSLNQVSLQLWFQGSQKINAAILCAISKESFRFYPLKQLKELSVH